jgi:hypothetical protein
MAGRGTAIADAYTTWINGQSWPAIKDPNGVVETWTLSRLWAPDATLQALQTKPLLEAVAMTAGSSELITRGKVKQAFVVALGLREKYSGAGAVPVAWYDDRAALIEAIAELSVGLVLTGYAGWPAGAKAVCESAEIDDLTNYQDVQEAKAFVAVVAVAFTDYRAIP